jgi:uncharacterized protein YndB with AHSA1/START domain
MTDRPLPAPTGRVVATDTGRDLVLTRTFAAPIDDVWASITEPERTARWFATWSGDPAPGRTIRYRLTFEGPDAVEADMTIDACDPPHHLAVSTVDEHGSWRLEARLEETAGHTTLTFTHHLDDSTNAGEVGPGWEYYLDNLVASRAGDPPPNFDDYFPAQRSHYEQQS